MSLRHNLDRETVLPLYIGLLVHNNTRKRDLIDTLFSKGLSVSYERVLQFTTALANREIQRYEYEKVICPSPLTNKIYFCTFPDHLNSWRDIQRKICSCICNIQIHAEF